MKISDDIFVLDEKEVTTTSSVKPDPITDDAGLVEQVVKSENPRLTGDDEILITEFPFVIGKDASCSFAIKDDTYISRKHCRIVKREDGYYIKDLDSTNGTFIDGKDIHEITKLVPGQEVILADRNYVWKE